MQTNIKELEEDTSMQQEHSIELGKTEELNPVTICSTKSTHAENHGLNVNNSPHVQESDDNFVTIKFKTNRLTFTNY